MDINKLTIFELRALLEFLKDYLNRDNLSHYDDFTLRQIFLSFLKIQNAVDHWEEVIKTMD